MCCAGGYANCSSTCVSLSTNQNCGSCGSACGANSTCSGGSCLLVDGQACTSAGQCLSGTCTTFYYDGDGDGYGTPTSSVSRCGTSPQAGFSSNSRDCCDIDPNAHPGAAASAVRDACSSYDWNCDGSASPVPHGNTQCGTIQCGYVNGTCTYIGGCTCPGTDAAACITYTVPGCGQQYYVNEPWCTDSGGPCSAIVPSHSFDDWLQPCN
jgi:hypothetical protein